MTGARTHMWQVVACVYSIYVAPTLVFPTWSLAVIIKGSFDSDGYHSSVRGIALCSILSAASSCRSSCELFARSYSTYQ